VLRRGPMRPAGVRISGGALRPIRRTGGRDHRDEDGPRDRDARDALQLRDRATRDLLQTRSARLLVAHANAADDVGPAESAVPLEHENPLLSGARWRSLRSG